MFLMYLDMEVEIFVFICTEISGLLWAVDCPSLGPKLVGV
jgi:hypothetical protein